MLRQMRKLLAAAGGAGIFTVLVILRSPFEAVYMLIQAVFLEHAFRAVTYGDMAMLSDACIRFGIAACLLFLYNGTVWSLYAGFSVRTEARLREKMFHIMLRLPMEQMEALSYGDWQTRINGDVRLGLHKPMQLPHAACALVSITVSFLLLLHIQWRAALLVLLLVLPHVGMNQLFVARKAAALRKRSQEAAAENLSDMNLFLVCADTAKLFDAYGYLGRRFQKSSKALMRNNFRIHFRKALGNAMIPVFSLSGYLLLLYVGSGMIADGRMDFGGLTALMQYRAGFLKGIFMLIACIVSLNEGLAGIRRVNETIDMGNGRQENGKGETDGRTLNENR
ncbi:ABC transporter transmembrane domain-containing protein [Eisenbergiella sp.]